MKTFDEVAWEYLNSPKYMRLSASSKRIYSTGFMTIRDTDFYEKEVQDITRPDIIEFRDTYYQSPGKLKIALTVLNNVLGFAYDRGMVKYNHAKGIGDLPPTKPIERWNEMEIDLFLSTAPQHLKDAMMVALYTGQRRSDLIALTWDKYDGKRFHVKQKKTGAVVDIPVHRKLKSYMLDLWERRQGPHILNNFYGHKWDGDSLRKAINRHNHRVGITGKTVHGIRKTTASLLAEAGCTPAQIMAITGHQTLKEVTRYTAEAGRAGLADDAMEIWE